MRAEGTTYIEVIPPWFLVLATVLIVIILGLFVGLMIVSLSLVKIVKELEPKVNKLIGHVNDDLIPQVQGVVTKVDAIGANIQGLTSSANNTMGLVRSKTEAVGSAIEGFTSGGMQKAEKFAPIMGYIMMGLRVYQTFSTVMAARAKENAQAETAKANAAKAKAEAKAETKALGQ